MIRLEDTTVKQLSSLNGHPFKRADYGDYEVFFDGEPRRHVVVADAINGYIKVLMRLPDGEYAAPVVLRNGSYRVALMRLKGKVEIYKRKEVSA